jgi:hypothetical protein
VSLEAAKRPPEFKKTSRVPPFSFVNRTKTRKMIAGHFLTTKSRTCAEVPKWRQEGVYWFAAAKAKWKIPDKWGLACPI